MPDTPTFDVSSVQSRLELDTEPTLRLAEMPEAGGGTEPSASGPGQAPYYGAYPGTAAPVEDVHLTHYLRVLYKRRRTAIAAFLVVLGATAAYTFTAPVQYEARAQVLIETENPNVVKFEEVLEQNKTTNDYYQTQYRILQSRVLARRVLDAENLWRHPLFATPSKSLLANMRAALGLAGSSQSAPPDASETAGQSRAIDAFLSHLTIAPVRNSRLVDVKYLSPEAELSARIANRVSTEYIQQSLELKSTTTKEASQFLTDRVNEQRKAVEQSEAALQKYRESTDSVSLEDKQNIVVQRLADVNAAVTRARTERMQKEGAWNQIRAIQSDRAALDTHPAILGNSFIQQLKSELGALQRQEAQLSEKLGDRHPDMARIKSAVQSTQQKLDLETAKIVQAIKNDYDAAVAQERSLSVALDQQKNEAMALTRQSITYGALQRDAASNRQMFEGLMQRAKETNIEGELKSSNIRIVDTAEIPRRPSTPNTPGNLAAGTLGGLFVALGLAFFFEYVDSRIKAPDEIKTHLGLPFLGMIPAVKEGAVTGPPLITGGAPHDFAEAFRALRTNVLFSSAEQGPHTLVVTSTAPGEGKTIVSANLAAALAVSGQRVLLVDADMRRPKVHEVFDLAQEPGISNLIVGNAKASEAVRKTSVPNLWVMAAGKTPPNPAELLGSRRFRDFIKSVGDHFDWILLDSPPVMAVTDASIIGHIASGVVFVIGSEMTQRDAAKSALNQLNGARVKYVGAVLNRVDLRRHGYYYSNYYRREYANYYGRVSA